MLNVIGVTQTPDELPHWSDFVMTIVFSSVGLALVMGLILWVYRSMQRPRLYLQYREPDLRPVVTWQAVLRYLVTTGLSLFVWMTALLVILTVAAQDRTAEQIALAMAAVIGASRVLAHVLPEGAHELGKTIPLAVISLILLGGSTSDIEQETIWTDLEANAAVLDTYYFILIIFDIVLTALWTLRQFGKWDTNQQGTWRHRVRSTWRRWVRPLHIIRDFGKPDVTHDRN